MEGLILIAVFTIVTAIGETFAVGIGLLSDKISPSLSLLIFFFGSALAVSAAWPIAVRLTKKAA
ncbi:hypothetical protein [Pseudorhodoplanes sinuspersici]|uniref:Uncharacterized protein n=1 Tax=Pseudorhodoplanes sinuspersici TaxID=1235591 RepID=A0A1W6ZSE8_9HYPH|nr:hypothetical protein [Pseudorhodoplanes sinuspersici]ARQ00263.1 hypothetical protein CAK95_15185 [Pseudorhodoplanes sinuspersici]RKE67582.1 hypothetical protein DFP91_5348 [Pseudorhodoplanes sinuspersici]